MPPIARSRMFLVDRALQGTGRSRDEDQRHSGQHQAPDLEVLTRHRHGYLLGKLSGEHLGQYFYLRCRRDPGRRPRQGSIEELCGSSSWNFSRNLDTATLVPGMAAEIARDFPRIAGPVPSASNQNSETRTGNFVPSQRARTGRGSHHPGMAVYAPGPLTGALRQM